MVMVPERRDYDLCREAIELFRSPMNDKRDGIWFKCFNQDEADMLKGIMAEMAPEIPVYTTYLVFVGGRDGL